MLDFESPPVPEHATISKEKLGGIVVDDSEAELTGFTTEGRTTPGFIGAGYRHDGDQLKGEQKARFIPDLPEAGQYRVAIAYSALGNRADNVPVIIHHADGEARVLVNQQKKAPEQGVLLPLGSYQFEKGKAGWVEVRNEGTKGHVIIDAAQWVPVK